MTARFPFIAGFALAAAFAATAGEPNSSPARTTVETAAEKPSTRPPLPGHERMLVLQFEAKDGQLTLAARTGAEGRVKPAPSPAGRTGVYFRALNAGGELICDGMLPDPFIVRIPPAVAAENPSTRPDPPAERDETSFLIRLPDVAALHTLELYRVPAGTPPATPRDAVEFRMGTIALTKQ